MYNDYNDKFIALYKSIRGKFFEKIKNNCGVDISAYYDAYYIFENEETKVVNASLKWCPTDKADFFLERASYLGFNIKSKI
ncbi:MAG: hypothetical protein UHS49_00960 [Faecalimonas sp.]|nr:hypothetical protein [Faecalimonas sp.]